MRNSLYRTQHSAKALTDPRVWLCKMVVGRGGGGYWGGLGCVHSKCDNAVTVLCTHQHIFYIYSGAGSPQYINPSINQTFWNIILCQKYTEMTHDPLLFSAAQGMFWLSTERLSRNTFHSKEGGVCTLVLCSHATMTYCTDPSVRIVTKSRKVGPLLISSIYLFSAMSALPSLLKLLLSRLPVLPPLVLKRGRRQGLQRARTDSFKMFRKRAGPQIVSKCFARWRAYGKRTDSFKMFR